ncbi:MAG: type II secretion system F family protein [Rehaibacterium terrae]|uniref:type II secretion system F family protein n=1 Tax=Rehaibacterium terrae TaxID=1341696 RepID=UPI00391C3D70
MNYRYQAIDKDGQQVSGMLEAASEREAGRILLRQGLTALSLVEDAPRRQGARFGRSASRRELQLVLQEFATLLESGVSLVTAVTSLARSSHHPQLTAAFGEIAKAVRRGDSFSQALREAKLPVPGYFHQLVEAGEATGKLAEALRGGVEQYEYDQQVRSEMRSALVYPSVLVLSGIAAIAIIFMWVVPRFGNLLAQSGDRMPDLARWVIGGGVWLNQNAMLVLLALAGLIALAVAVLRQPTVQARLGEWAASLPLVGQWLIEAEVGRWAGTLSTLLSNRVELIRALDLSAGAVRLGFIRSRLQQVGKSVKGGATLSSALREHRALNPTGYDLVAVGEASGELPKLLRALANLYQASGRDRMKRALQLIEPLAIIVIGVVIGTIVTAVILAITSVHDVPL